MSEPTKLILGKRAAGPVLPGRTIRLPVAKADRYIASGAAVSVDTLPERKAASVRSARTLQADFDLDVDERPNLTGSIGDTPFSESFTIVSNTDRDEGVNETSTNDDDPDDE